MGARLAGAAMLALASGLFAGDPFVARTFQTARGPAAVAIADVDGDGRGEIVVACVGANVVQILSPGRPTVTIQTMEGPCGLLVRDLNHDGVPEIVVACNFQNRLLILMGKHGSYVPSKALPSREGPVAICAADANRDGNLDLIAANLSTGELLQFLQEKTGFRFFAPTLLEEIQTPTCVLAQDLNRDGIADLLASASEANSVDVMLGQLAGGFSRPKSLKVGDRPNSLAVADLNGDGWPDIVTTLDAIGGGAVLLGGKGGTSAEFEAPRSLLLPARSNGVVAADLDGDRIVDLALTQPAQNQIAVLSGKGNGTFSPAVFIAAGRSPVALATGDVDGDGRPDIVSANMADNTVTLWTRR